MKGGYIMLDECLRIFKQELKDNTNLVLNTIILADGDYVLVHSDGTYDVEKIKRAARACRGNTQECHAGRPRWTDGADGL